VSGGLSGGLSTHVLDTAAGAPAAGIPVTLERRDAQGAWCAVATHVTGADGRVAALLPAGVALEAADYRLTFAVGERAPFFGEVAVVIAVTAPGTHHHVPLLLSPFGYTTYRGS
jgi:5-hydroxyisourate hydrolase